MTENQIVDADVERWKHATLVVNLMLAAGGWSILCTDPTVCFEQAGHSVSHCWMHGVDEPIGDDYYRVCFECGHVYNSEEALVQSYADGAPSDMAPADMQTDPEKIFFCPECLHDF